MNKDSFYIAAVVFFEDEDAVDTEHHIFTIEFFYSIYLMDRLDGRFIIFLLVVLFHNLCHFITRLIDVIEGVGGSTA
ncbi:hypothetical protein ACJX0J_032415, partial [Zea mays]